MDKFSPNKKNITSAEKKKKGQDTLMESKRNKAPGKYFPRTKKGEDDEHMRPVEETKGIHQKRDAEKAKVSFYGSPDSDLTRQEQQQRNRERVIDRQLMIER